MAKKRMKDTTLGGFAETNHDAAGIDVGNAQHWVAVPAGRDTVRYECSAVLPQICILWRIGL